MSRKGQPLLSHSAAAGLQNVTKFHLGQDIVLNIVTSDLDSLQTGGSIWHASCALSQYICSNQHLIQGKTVLEIGAGCGLVGLCAAALGATEVTFTDIEAQLEVIQRNIDINELKGIVRNLILSS